MRLPPNEVWTAATPTPVDPVGTTIVCEICPAESVMRTPSEDHSSFPLTGISNLPTTYVFPPIIRFTIAVTASVSVLHTPTLVTVRYASAIGTTSMATSVMPTTGWFTAKELEYCHITSQEGS